MNKTHPVWPLRLGLVGLTLALGACLCSSLGSSGVNTPLPPSPTPTAQPLPTTVPQAQITASDNLETDQIPIRDRYDLAARFKHLALALPTVQPGKLPQVGDVQSFWVDNTQTDEVSHIQAHLVYAGDHVAVWVEDGLKVDQAALEKSARRFDQQTYPTDRAYFGSEPNPGIDGDPRVHILINTKMGSEAAGYFNSPSEYPASIVPNSNEKEMFYMNGLYTEPGTAQFDAILAHEFQHMIHWNVDRNEDTWVNEGMSEVATFLNGFGMSAFAPSFFAQPQTQLDTWNEGGDNASHYGAAFMFNSYFLDRFGKDALRALVKNPDNGLHGFDTTLAALNTHVTADDLFKDWLVANLLNDPAIAGGKYSYRDFKDLPPLAIRQVVTSYPASLSDEVSQYGAHYIQLQKPGRVTLHFEGAPQVAILPTQIGEGTGGEAGKVWWSNRADDSDMTLTREIDLTGVQQAQIDFDLWYWIEEAWDYGYVEVSDDGGKTWRILKTDAGTISNPHGNSYGPGYSGQSKDQSGADSQGWLHQSANLTAYAGKKVLLRFEMITDDAINEPGMALDNICVQAINWCDNAEQAVPGWDAEGFARIDNLIPQRYSVQVVNAAGNGSSPAVEMPLDAANRGDLTITVGSRPVTVIIAGMTRHTTEPAPYQLSITPGA